LQKSLAARREREILVRPQVDPSEGFDEVAPPKSVAAKPRVETFAR
jgi:hypothetical protein